MKRRKSPLEIFSMSFLDIISCGFGAIILLFVISKQAEPMVIEGIRENLEGVIAELQRTIFDYAPHRRSIVWTIGDCIIKAKGEYKAVYNKRKVYERKAHPKLTDGHTHNRAKRYMEKRLLCDLWEEWNTANGNVLPRAPLPDFISQ